MKQSIFLKLFPPPRFLSTPAVGLDISDESIHFVELLPFGEGYMIKKFGEKKIPEKVIESGEIKKPKELINILASLLKNEFSSNVVNVSLPEQRAYLLKMRSPHVNKKEIRNNLELQLEDNVPIPAVEAVFDYDLIEVNKKESYIEVSLSVLPSKVVENYVDIIESAGFSPLSFEIAAQSIARCVIPEGDEGTFMIIDFGRVRTGISIVNKGVTLFTSTVEIGGVALTRAIKRALSVSMEEAEEIKKEKGITGHDKNSELFLTMMSIIGVLKDEANKHYVYWHTHKDSYGEKRPAIEKIILCGGDSNLSGLSDYLSTGIHIPVELANGMVNVNSFEQYIPEMPFVDSLRFTTAIGLALRQLD